MGVSRSECSKIFMENENGNIKNARNKKTRSEKGSRQTSS